MAGLLAGVVAFAGTNTSTSMRTQATQRANNNINGNFDTHPGFNGYMGIEMGGIPLPSP